MSPYGYKLPSAVAANHVRSYSESSRKQRHLFTAAGQCLSPVAAVSDVHM
jgi:hypothetical protein